MFTEHEIEQRFGHTAASIEGPFPQETNNIHEEIRFAFKNLAHVLDDAVPDSRQKSVAFTELETAAMLFHKALAHN